MKTREIILLAVIIVAVGAAAALAWTSANRLAASRQEIQTAVARADNAERDLKAARDEIRKLERRLLAAESERDSDSQAQQAVDAPPATEFMPEALVAEMDEPQAPEPADETPDRAREQRRERDDRRPARTPEEEARRTEFRQQFVDNMRTQASSFIQQNIDASPDAASQQRLASIGQYLDTMFEQGQQLRDAQSDEERRQIRQNMRQNGEELQGLVQQQQEAMLRGLVEQYGVTDPNKQTAIIDSFNQLRQSPFFAFDPGQFMGAAGAFGRFPGAFGGGPGGWGMSGGRGMRGPGGGR